MTPLQPTTATPESRAATIADLIKRSGDWWHQSTGQRLTTDDEKRAAAEAVLDAGGTMFANETYCVHVREMGDGKHLSIKRHDRQPAIDWRDKQAIKNQLCGEDWEGVEMYPAESRVVDLSNQFHLWVYPFALPFGFPSGLKADSDDQIGNSVQRPLPSE